MRSLRINSKRAGIILVLAAICVGYGPLSTKALAQQTGNAQIEAFAVAQQEARDKVKSFTLEMSETYERPKEGFRSDVLHKQVMSGYKVWIERVEHMSGGEEEEGEEGLITVEDVTARLVANDRCVAIRMDPGGSQIWEHDQYETMSPSGKEELTGNNPRDPLHFGFNVDGDPLSRIYRVTSEHPWEVVENWDEIDGKPCLTYLVRRYFKEPSTQAALECEVDPGRGHLITAVRRFRDDGFLQLEIRAKVREVQPGIWFPVEYELTSYARAQDSQGYVNSQSKNVVTKVEINPQVIAPSQFELESLGLQNGEFVHRTSATSATGETELVVFRDGALVAPDFVVQAGTE